MADIRINSLPTTAVASSSDDFLALDGTTNGTRKLNAYSPTFGGNLTVTGALLSHQTGTLNMAYEGSSLSQLVAYGADASTYGRANIILRKAGTGVGAVTALALTSTDATFGGNLTTGSNSTLSTSAGYLLIQPTTTLYLRANSGSVAIADAGIGTVSISQPGSTTTVQGNLTVSGTGDSRFAGKLAIGASPLADRMFYVSGNTGTSGATQFGAVINPTLPNTVTSTAYGVYVSNNIASGATVTNGYSFYIAPPDYAGSTVTNKWGLYVADTNPSFIGGNITVSGGLVTLNNATSNLIYYNTNGVAAPTVNTRSAGTKIVLYDGLSASTVDYAIGINAGTFWNSVPGTTQIFSWYGGTATAMWLSGTGNLNVSGDISAGALFKVADGQAIRCANTGPSGSFYLDSPVITWRNPSTSYSTLAQITPTGFSIATTTASVSITTGALTVAGGVGVAGNLYSQSVFTSILYDLDNTNFYVNPASTSNFNSVKAASFEWGSLVGLFGQPYYKINELTDFLHRADVRFTVTNGNSIYFDGNYDSAVPLSGNSTIVININVANQSGVPAAGITYPEGKIYVSFYYTYNQYTSISLRTKHNGTWITASAPVNVSTAASYKVMEFTIGGNNYLTDIELTVVTGDAGTAPVWLAAINYYMNRWTTEAELPYFSKYLATNRYNGTFALTGIMQANKTASVGTPASYPFQAQVGGVTELAIGSDGSNAIIQSWNSRPLTINSQGNNVTIGGATTTVTGNLVVSGGTITGGTSGLSLASGGTNQNITLTPSGTGRTNAYGSVPSSTWSGASDADASFNAGLVVGPRGTGSSFGVSTASASGAYPSGLLIDGSYTAFASTVNIKAVGVYSGGGYGASLAFHTSNNTTLSEVGRFTKAGNFLIGTTTDMAGSGGLKIAGTTATSNLSTGALIVAGGVGVSGDVNAANFGIQGNGAIVNISNGGFIKFVSDGSISLRSQGGGNDQVTIPQAGGLATTGKLTVGSTLSAKFEFSPSYTGDGVWSANARPSTFSGYNPNSALLIGYADDGGGSYYPSIGFKCSGDAFAATAAIIGSRYRTTAGVLDSADRFQIQTAGKILWGSGSAAQDVSLYRSATGTLAVTGNLTISGTVASTSTGWNTFAGSIATTGANSLQQASTSIIDHASGFRAIGYGANTSTPAGFSFIGLSSDGSVGGTRFSIDSSGNSTFAGSITVNSTPITLSASGTVQFVINSTNSGSKEIVFKNAGSVVGYVWNNSGYTAIGGGSEATSLFVTSATGNVGIGIYNPSYKLQVVGDAKITGSLTVDDGTESTATFGLKTYTKSLQIGTTWLDTGISGTDLATGSYIIQVYVNNYSVNGGQYFEAYTGVMSWYQLTTNSTEYDEIVLHKAGHAPSGNWINLRTLRQANPGTLKLQIISNVATNAATNYVFKFRRLV